MAYTYYHLVDLGSFSGAGAYSPHMMMSLTTVIELYYPFRKKYRIQQQ